VKYRCLTNNPYIIEHYKEQVEPFEGSPLELFLKIREEILAGYKLVTHPLTGSIAPNINPYKTIILDAQKKEINEESLNLIELAITRTQSLMPDYTTCYWSLNSKLDFQYLDFCFVRNFLNS
jgi:hypothetical protein